MLNADLIETLGRAALQGIADPILASGAVIDAKAVYGLGGDNDPGDEAKVQRAFDTAPVGCTLYFRAGVYKRAAGSWRVTRAMNIVGDGQNTVFRGDYNADDPADVLQIDVVDAGGFGDVRGMTLKGLNVSANTLGVGIGGRHAVAVGVRNPRGLTHHGLTIRGCLLGGGAADGLRVSLFDTQYTNIVECPSIDGIALSGCSDGTKIIGNLIGGGQVPGITVDVVAGAFETLILGNAIVARDGAIRIVDGSTVNIIGNQMEQAPATNRLRALVQIVGSIRIAAANQIRFNNFGGGSNVAENLNLRNARGTVIEGNQFGIAAERDIHLEDAGHGAPCYNTLGENWPRGPRAARSLFDLTDTTRRLAISESATCRGNRGFWKPLPAMAAGWTNQSATMFLDERGFLRFDGRARGGLVESGTVIGVLPLGYRPRKDAYVPVGTGSGPGELRFAASGEISVINLPGVDIDLATVTFPADWMDDYDIGP